MYNNSCDAALPRNEYGLCSVAGATMTFDGDDSLIALGYSPSGAGAPEGSANSHLLVQKEPARASLWSSFRKK